MSGLRSHVLTLALLSAGLWLAAAGPALFVAGVPAIEGLTYAVLLCALPGFVSLLIAERGRDRDRAFAGMLVGTGLRMAAVLTATLLLRAWRPDLGPLQFHIWLIVAYLATLAIETRQLLAGERLVRTQSPAANAAG
jgi:hypothetical protein